MKKFIFGMLVMSIIMYIINKIIDRDKVCEVCDDCPVYVEKNGADVTYHYDD